MGQFPCIYGFLFRNNHERECGVGPRATLHRIIWLFWTMSIVSYVEVLQKTTTFRRLDLSPSSGEWGRVDLLRWARQSGSVSVLR
jgi:hypothetical protein